MAAQDVGHTVGMSIRCLASGNSVAQIAGMKARWRITIGLLGAALLSSPVMAESWAEPERGSPTREALMDALRPHAEWMLARPVQFVIHDLRLSGSAAFANVTAQRPGGAAIDLDNTPGARRGAFDPDYMDGSSLQALYLKSGETWVAVHWKIGATDAWWYDPALCPDWADVIPEACAPR